MNKAEKPLSTLWGCELNDSNKEETFKTDDTNHQHQLALRTMCLGHTAKDEFNIVELVTGEADSAKAVPIATLHSKSMPTSTEITSEANVSEHNAAHLCPPETRLYVSLHDLEEYSDEEMDEDEEVEEEEEEEEDIEESPVKKPTKNGAGKRKKPEKAEDEEGSDAENPPKKVRLGKLCSEFGIRSFICSAS
ncbi:hypothetical protein DNTS_032447 [Danionella cerebrum]|uniref:Nucleoplasmin core domain-containing protein n=1 Tax=Danionella cerebrum TaxID=2873325 RepID=A0A553Q3B6_9TELE|nr:hypothetical protein DNTS_032447 [Danionella translucida]